MSFSVTPLLLHREDVPATARQALLAAYDEPAERRASYLESAASILHRELDLDCGEARELVGLWTAGGCC